MRSASVTAPPRVYTHLHISLPLFQADISVNWCPALGTVLANEEVIDGKSERGGHPVIKKVRGWVLPRMGALSSLLYRIKRSLLYRTWAVPAAHAPMDAADYRVRGSPFGRFGGPGLAGEHQGDAEELDWTVRGGGGGVWGEGGGEGESIRVYTTRPDTLCGAT